MSATGAAWFKRGIQSYFHGLREAGRHTYRHLKILRVFSERIMTPRALPHPVRNVLFVCARNLCRSPLAEAYFRDKARKESVLISVNSAGIETLPGRPAHNLAREVAGQFGVSLENHAAKQLYQKLLDQSDLILVMEVSQKERLARLYPHERHKIFVLGRFCSSGSLDIADPHRGSREDFRICFERIKDSCDRLIEKLTEARE